jgi:hypothetical protein
MNFSIKPGMLIPSYMTVNTSRCADVVEEQLKGCAELLKDKLYQWNHGKGIPATLKKWDSKQECFISFCNESFCQYLSDNFDLHDSSGQHFQLPHPSVVSRIWECCIRATSPLPVADYKTVIELRKKEVK